MGAAQAHSDYQASIGQVTHYSSDGSGPLDRAYAWGFGDGARAFVSENIAGGYKVTIEIAIYDFWQDAAHLHTMLNPNAIYIGAGVAISGSSTYYTVITGYYVGSQPKPTATSDGATTPVPGTTSAPQPTAVTYDPFIISTPREDGAIIHVVGSGQTLIGIANTYGVDLADLYKFNGYNKNTVIYPNEWVIIRPADESSITETPEKPAATLVPTGAERSQRPTYTPREPQTIAKPSTTASTEEAIPELSLTPGQVSITEGQEPLVLGIVFLSMVVLMGVIFYSLLSRKNG
jgi:LysM repeat protein